MKQKAVENVTKRLENEQCNIRDRLSRNRINMAALVEEQTVLKRELAVLGALIGGLKD